MKVINLFILSFLLISINSAYGFSKSSGTLGWGIDTEETCSSGTFIIATDFANTNYPDETERAGQVVTVDIDDIEPELTTSYSGGFDVWYDYESFTDAVFIDDDGSPAISGIDTMSIDYGLYSYIHSGTGEYSETINGLSEGTYDISMNVKDLSNYSNETGVFNVANFHDNSFSGIIKLDRSFPIIKDYLEDTDSGSYIKNEWTKESIIITGIIQDDYAGVQSKTRSFNCEGAPENSTRIGGAIKIGICELVDVVTMPDTMYGPITGPYTSPDIAPDFDVTDGKVCTDPSYTPWDDSTMKECSVDEGELQSEATALGVGGSECLDDFDFSPNLDDCEWSCNSGYIDDGGVCVELYSDLICDDINKKDKLYIRSYNGTDNIETVYDMGITSWTSPDSISSSGEFSAIYNTGTHLYEPDISECEWDCNSGSHKGTNEAGVTPSCLNDHNFVHCIFPMLTLMGENGGGVVGGDGKDIEEKWNGTSRDYISEDGTFSTFNEACGVDGTVVENSDGATCNPKFHLTGDDSVGYVCETVPVGEYSGQNNNKLACTSFDGSNGEFTSNGSTATECTRTCDTYYHKSGSSCVANARTTGISWSGCSASCGPGSKSRSVSCSYSPCNPSTRPSSSKSCNSGACPEPEPEPEPA